MKLSYTETRICKFLGSGAKLTDEVAEELKLRVSTIEKNLLRMENNGIVIRNRLSNPLWEVDKSYFCTDMQK